MCTSSQQTFRPFMFYDSVPYRVPKLYNICIIFVLKQCLGSGSCFLTSLIHSLGCRLGSRSEQPTYWLFRPNLPHIRLDNQGFNVVCGFCDAPKNHSTHGQLMKAFKTYPLIFMPHLLKNMLHLLLHTSNMQQSKENDSNECTV